MLNSIKILEKIKIKQYYYYILYTKYGNCKMQVCDYDKGLIPNIKSALNKTEYYINECKEIHNNKYDYSLVEYTKAHSLIKIICPEHGIFEQAAYSHKQGIGCPKCSTNADEEEIKSKLISKDYEIISYSSQKIIVKNKYGSYKTTAHRIRNNIYPTIATAINKTEIFVNQSNEIHNNRYSYFNTEVINMSKKVLVTCPIHGDFRVTPSHHLNNFTGCKRCSAYVFSNKQQCSYKTTFLYLIRCFNENEEFYKIGITSKSVKQRFRTSRELPYNYEIEFLFEHSPKVICKLEADLHFHFKNFQYFPNIFFEGRTECFSKIENYLSTIQTLVNSYDFK